MSSYFRLDRLLLVLFKVGVERLASRVARSERRSRSTKRATRLARLFRAIGVVFGIGLDFLRLVDRLLNFLFVGLDTYLLGRKGSVSRSRGSKYRSIQVGLLRV